MRLLSRNPKAPNLAVGIVFLEYYYKKFWLCFRESCCNFEMKSSRLFTCNHREETMNQMISTQDVILEKVRKRLGTLDAKAEQAVAEAVAILNESRASETHPRSEDEKFLSANVSVVQYEAWSPEKRFQYQSNAQKINARWIENQLQKLNVEWVMVIDGHVVAHGASIQSLPRDQQFDMLCKKYGKYPFVFFNPSLFMIEEATTAWHATKDSSDAYPTVTVILRNGNAELSLCIRNWPASPFVAINPNRTALIGRSVFHKIVPIVHLDFAARRTEIEHQGNS
jgi:hypothetical protein